MRVDQVDCYRFVMYHECSYKDMESQTEQSSQVAPQMKLSGPRRGVERPEESGTRAGLREAQEKLRAPELGEGMTTPRSWQIWAACLITCLAGFGGGLVLGNAPLPNAPLPKSETTVIPSPSATQDEYRPRRSPSRSGPEYREAEARESRVEGNPRNLSRTRNPRPQPTVTKTRLIEESPDSSESPRPKAQREPIPEPIPEPESPSPNTPALPTPNPCADHNDKNCGGWPSPG